MEDKDFTYDIFISYAHEDYDWVRESLYTPLTQCVMSDGRRPKIFLDKSDMGLKVSQNFLPALAKAISTSHRVILVYSKNFFAKEMTIWEMTKALQADPIGISGKINPILIDHEAENQIPDEINHIHYLNVQKEPTLWLPRLIDNMGLKKSDEIRQLELKAALTDVIVSHTLAPISVALSDWGKSGTKDETVELSASADGLQGTLKQKTSGGTATFSDLSFRQTADQVVLSAKADGYKPAFSSPFSVAEQKTDSRKSPGGGLKATVTIPSGGSPERIRIHFFNDGKTFAMVEEKKIRLFDLSGRPLAEIPLPSKIELVRDGGSWMAFADWSGRLLLLRETGESKEIFLHPDDPSYAIPGNCSVSEDQVLVGMWNGDFIRIDPVSGESSLVFNHPAGIMDFLHAGCHVYLVDFQGRFILYQDGAPVRHFTIERSIAGMKLFRENIVIIGEKNLYQYSLADGQLTPWDPNLSNIVYAMPAENWVLALDDGGSGLFADEQLITRMKFHTTTGARPYCIGIRESDLYVSFIYPDQSCALLKNGQIVYTQPAGLLSFDPRIRSLALGSPEGVQIWDGSSLPSLFGKA
ncbi:TIR domain-containing protein [bacterium]|nr:TIR domain-containing protein [bacterium]